MSIKFIMEHNPKDWDFINELKDKFPNFRAVAMGFVGKAGTDKLKKAYLSGQEINLASEKDKIGRRTVNYSIGKRASAVTFTSYPVNLFEHGRKLRDGSTETGKKIITGKLKNAMASGLKSILDEYDSKYLQKELNKL